MSRTTWMSQTVRVSRTNEAIRGGWPIAILSAFGPNIFFYLFFGPILDFYESGHLIYHNIEFLSI